MVEDVRSKIGFTLNTDYDGNLGEDLGLFVGNIFDIKFKFGHVQKGKFCF